jgi:hypothetical protein
MGAINWIELIKEALQENDNEITFTDSVKVKLTPHTPMERIVNLFLSDDIICYECKDSEGISFLDESDETVQQTIWQRIKLLKFQNKLK